MPLAGRPIGPRGGGPGAAREGARDTGGDRPGPPPARRTRAAETGAHDPPRRGPGRGRAVPPTARTRPRRSGGRRGSTGAAPTGGGESPTGQATPGGGGQGPTAPGARARRSRPRSRGADRRAGSAPPGHRRAAGPIPRKARSGTVGAGGFPSPPHTLKVPPIPREAGQLGRVPPPSAEWRRAPAQTGADFPPLSATNRTRSFPPLGWIARGGVFSVG